MADPKALALKAATLAVSNLRAAEVGGCFNPVDDPKGECADGDCYCARQCEREADAAVAAYHGALAPTDAAPSPEATDISERGVQGALEHGFTEAEYRAAKTIERR